MDNLQVAAVLEEIGTLLELQGENPFRCLAYSKAARELAQLERNLAEIIAAGELDQIPGIGETLRDKITLLATTDHLPFYEDLKKKTPPGLLLLLRLPGIGPKKVKAMYEQLGIDDLDKLKAACESGDVAKLKGFGAKTQDKILEGIAFVDRMGQRVRIDEALELAELLTHGLKACPGIIRMEVCGSLRRRKETIQDIDILISSDKPAPIMEAFVKLPQVQRVLGQGDTKSSVVVTRGKLVMNADLRVVSDAQYPFALNYFTGSKEHNVAMRQRAIQYGLKLNEYELTPFSRSPTASATSAPVHCKEEADIYRALDLDYVPSELRENTGELIAAASHKLPDLLDHEALTGTFHCHTTASDGNATLAEMALAAKLMGYKYLGIADHSQSLTIANGLDPTRVRQQHKEIDALNKKLKGMHVFKGTEVDILADGSLDFDDKVLKTFDYVVASVHSHFNQTQEEMTARIVKAVSHPRVTMLGHATGRLLLRRDGYKVDLEAVLQAAAKHGTMIEINANPRRLDLDWIHCKRARALGVKLVINPDAHSTEEFANNRFGIDVARRGWLEKKDVFNTMSFAEVKKALAAGKRGPV